MKRIGRQDAALCADTAPKRMRRPQTAFPMA